MHSMGETHHTQSSRARSHEPTKKNQLGNTSVKNLKVKLSTQSEPGAASDTEILTTAHELTCISN